MPADYPEVMIKSPEGFGAPNDCHAFVKLMPPHDKGIVNGVIDPKRITDVMALVLELTNRDDDGRPLGCPLEPEDILGHLPYRSVAWETPTSTEEHPQYFLVFPFLEPLSPGDFDQFLATLKPRLPLSDGVRPCSPDEWIPTPAVIPGTPARVRETYLESFRSPVLQPRVFLGDSPKKELDPDDWTPEHAEWVLMALVRSDIVRWAKANPDRASSRLLKGIATNFVEVSRSFNAALPTLGPTEASHYLARRCHAEFLKILAAQPAYRRGGSSRQVLFSETFVAAQLSSGPTATYRDLVELGYPADRAPRQVVSPIREADDTKQDEGATKVVSVMNRSPLYMARTIVDAFGEHDPNQWFFDGPSNKYRKLTDDGELSREDFVEAAFRKLVAITDKRLYAYFDSEVRRVHRHEFQLSSGERLLRSANEWVLNTYHRPTLVPREDAAKAEHLRALLLNLVGEDADALEYLLDWLAVPVQALHRQGKHQKLLTAVTLHGDQGSGKGTLTELLKLIYGATNVEIIDQDRLESQFNGMLQNRLLVVANEVHSASRDERKLSAKLKAYITDPTFVYEEKNVPARAETNYFNIIFSSNDDRPNRVEPGDRRFSIFRSKKLAPAVGAAVNEQKKEYAEVLLGLLLARQPTSDGASLRANKPYVNAARERLASASLPAADRFALALGDEGYIAMHERLEVGSDTRYALIEVDGDLLYPTFSKLNLLFKQWCSIEGCPYPKDANADLSAALRRRFALGDSEENVRRVRIAGDKQVTVWAGIPLRTGDKPWLSGSPEPK